MEAKRFSQKIVFLLLALVIAVFGWWGSRPWVFIQGESEMLASAPAYAGESLSISFVHSVQKTPVEEFLTVDDELSGLVLNSTRYHSFGVGLPFMESDGDFYQDGNDFVMDNMNRRFDNISLRTGLGTKLTVSLAGKSYPIYENHDLGYRVDIFIAPRAYGIPYISAFYKYFSGR